jgi:hypothetical protein
LLSVFRISIWELYILGKNPQYATRKASQKYPLIPTHPFRQIPFEREIARIIFIFMYTNLMISEPDSVANWQKFRPQNTKVAPQKSQQPNKSAAKFSTNLPENGRKDAELF